MEDTCRALPDSGASPGLPCLDVAPASAKQLPRFPGDERRPWFCFEDPHDAVERLGAAPEVPRPARIVIDRYTTARAFTDAFDTARLVRVLPRN